MYTSRKRTLIVTEEEDRQARHEVHSQKQRAFLQPIRDAMSAEELRHNVRIFQHPFFRSRKRNKQSKEE